MSIYEVNNKPTIDKIENFDDERNTYYRFQNKDWEMGTQSWGMIYSSPEEAIEDGSTVLNGKSCCSTAKELLHEMYKTGTPIRLIGMRVDNLIEKDELQLSFFNQEDTEKQDKIDKVVDELKQKYGYNTITRAGKLHSEDKIKLKDI